MNILFFTSQDIHVVYANIASFIWTIINLKKFKLKENI